MMRGGPLVRRVADAANSDLILVSQESLHLVKYPERWRAGDRLIQGPPSPFLSAGPRPSFHRTRTVAWAACEAVAQGRDKMDTIVVGIDVSKDLLAVHVRPAGTALPFSR